MASKFAVVEGDLLAEARADIAVEMDARFDALLPLPSDGRDDLYLAMRHAAIGGGKRLRPLLVLGACQPFAVPREAALRCGLAVECIHAYSLVHDDLPAMDDDDLRHGKPTVHKAFGEATAILAGDCLHAMAFEILADPATHSDGNIRAELIATLARAAGPEGMGGGQMLDLVAGERRGDADAIIHLQRLKTGALIAWCVAAGAMLGEASGDDRAALVAYGDAVGLAFQIVDDLLDTLGEEALTGKRVGKDDSAGKGTLVSLLGVEGARAEAQRLAAEAEGHVTRFGDKGDLLRAIARFTVERDH